MKPLTEPEIRAAFVNCSKGEAKRLPVPRDLAAQPWDDLDFLGWRDPQGSGRAYLVAVLGGLSAFLAKVTGLPAVGPADVPVGGYVPAAVAQFTGPG